MKKKIVRIVLASLLAVSGVSSILPVTSCASDSDEIEKVYNANITGSGDIVMDGTNGHLSVANDVTSIDFEKKIVVSDQASYVVSATSDYADTSTKSFALNEGDNVFYLRVTAYDNSKSTDYVITVYRLKTLTVTFDTDGGTEISNYSILEGETLDVSKFETTRTGYTFSGFILPDGTVVDNSYKMTSDITLKAVWIPNENTSYRVLKYFENLEGIFYDDPSDWDVLYGTTGTLTKAEAVEEKGFETPVFEQLTISGDGNTEVKLYYKRKVFKLTVNGSHGSISYAGETSVRYGTTLTISVSPDAGYRYTGITVDGVYSEENDVEITMPDKDVTVDVSIVPLDSTPYQVIYYYQDLDDDEYTPSSAITLYGVTDTLTEAPLPDKEGFTTPDFEQMNINGDGSTVCHIYYNRNTHTVSTSVDNSLAGEITAGNTYKYGADISITYTIADTDKYTFENWYDGETLLSGEKYTVYVSEDFTSYTITFKMPDKDMNIIAKTRTMYQVVHRQQNINDDNYSDVKTETLYGTVGEQTAATANEYTGFNLWADPQNEEIKADGSTVIYIYYDRIKYTLSCTTDVYYGIDTWRNNAFGTYKYGATATFTISSVKLGYEAVWMVGEESKGSGLTQSFTVTGDMQITVMRIKSEMSNYNFTSTSTTCVINSLVDSAVSDVVLPSYVTEIKDVVFKGNTSLTSITVDGKCTTIPANAFNGCTALKSVVLESGVKVIKASAFNSCTSLTDISLPTTLTTLGAYAFGSCTSLEAITIPWMNIASDGIDTVILQGCTNLKELTISGSGAIYVNTTSSSMAGININTNFIFRSDMNADFKLVFAEGITSIGAGVVSSNYGVTEVVLPSTMTSICNNLLADFYSLKKLTIPKSITSFGVGAFYGDSALTEIIYTGTKAQWNSISFGAGWNTSTGAYTITCTDGVITKS